MTLSNLISEVGGAAGGLDGVQVVALTPADGELEALPEAAPSPADALLRPWGTGSRNSRIGAALPSGRLQLVRPGVLGQ